jgi:hypothetical protein
MAILHFKINHHSKLNPNSSSSRAVSYITREAQFSSRDDLIHVESRNLPAWAPTPREFFTASQQHERANGRWATSFEFSLPRELSREHQLQLTNNFLQSTLGDKPYAYAMHELQASDKQANPHIHALFSERSNGRAFDTAEAFFHRENPKDVFFTQRRMVSRVREALACHINRSLEQEGYDVRVSPQKAITDQKQAQVWWDIEKRSFVGMNAEQFHAAVSRQMREGAPGHYPTATTLRAQQVHLDNTITQHTQYHRQLEKAIEQKITHRDNPVVLRKLQHLLDYDLENIQESQHQHVAAFEFQRDVDRSR